MVSSAASAGAAAHCSANDEQWKMQALLHTTIK